MFVTARARLQRLRLQRHHFSGDFTEVTSTLQIQNVSARRALEFDQRRQLQRRCAPQISQKTDARHRFGSKGCRANCGVQPAAPTANAESGACACAEENAGGSERACEMKPVRHRSSEECARKMKNHSHRRGMRCSGVRGVLRCHVVRTSSMADAPSPEAAVPRHGRDSGAPG